jgi:uncharacterized protein involved in exopolysaccharide biosynthesis
LRTREIVALLFKDLKFLSIAFLLPLLLALGLYLVAPRRYEAGAKILVNVRGSQSAIAAEPDGGGPQTTAVEVINSEVEVLTSRDLAQKTSDALVGAAARPLSEKDFKRFARDLAVKAVPTSHVIDVGFEAETPARAAQVLKTYLAIYQKMRDPSGPGSVAEAIKAQLAALEADLARTDGELARVRSKAGLFDPDLERRNLLDSRSQLSAAAVQLRAHAAELRTKVATLAQQRRATPLAIAQFPTADESDGMIKVRGELLALRQQQAKLAQNYQPDSRVMRDLQGQIDRTQAALADETQRFAARTKPGRNPLYDALTAEAAQDAAQVAPDERHAQLLDAQEGAIDRRLKEIAEIEMDLAPLSRRRASDAAAIEALGQRQASAALGAAGDNRALQSVSVIETPTAPGDAHPTKPKKVIYLLGGVVGGLTLAGGALAAAFARKNTFLVPEAVEAFTDIPVLVSLPTIHS